jgi:hypothetical protein
MNTTYFQITLETAMILETSLHLNWTKVGSAFVADEMRWLSKRIGAVLLDRRPVWVELDTARLWELRRVVDPSMRVGNVSGLEVIAQIYKAILALEPIAIELEPVIVVSARDEILPLGEISSLLDSH